MDVVVNTSLVVETSWGPELLHIVTGVVVVKTVLTEPANEEQSDPVGFKSGQKALDI